VHQPPPRMSEGDARARNPCANSVRTDGTVVSLLDNAPPTGYF
jgi:hypothetical protein